MDNQRGGRRLPPELLPHHPRVIQFLKSLGEPTPSLMQPFLDEIIERLEWNYQHAGRLQKPLWTPYKWLRKRRKEKQKPERKF